MPYLRFTTNDKQSVQLSGNNYDDFKKAIEKHGQIKASEYALAWVKAYFVRRDIEVTLQKAARGEIRVDTEELEQKLEVAYDEEDKYHEAYEAVSKGKKTDVTLESEAAATTTKETSFDDLYGQAGQINDVSEDLF